MRLQDNQANCGPYALKNALAAIGIERTAAELEAACKTSATRGTSTANLVRAIAKIDGLYPVKVLEAKRDVALLRLRFALLQGRPVLLSWCSERPGDHWVAAIGMIGERYLVADAADPELVLSYSVEELEEHWRDSKYEGVIL